MPVELWIDDGDPTWLSPDIWVVPGTDPYGQPGSPTANLPSYIWTRVHNRGTSAVNNARVNFYWADPSTMITRFTANLVGTSYVSLDQQESREVLCLVQWIPTWVNNGHECLFAEAFSPDDPIPPYSADGTFNVAADRHVAQRNIIVLQPNVSSTFWILPFFAGNPPREKTSKTILEVKRLPIKLLKNLGNSIDPNIPLKEMPEIPEFGLQIYRCGDTIKEVGENKLSLKLGANEQIGIAFAARIPRTEMKKMASLFLIKQTIGETIIGGLGIVLTSS